MGLPFVARSLLSLALLTHAATAFAGAFTVSPTRIELEGADRSGMVTLRNGANSETIVQVEAFAWEDSPSIADLRPTRDILAVPTVFRLAPRDRQVVRIRGRGQAETVERAYRLVLSEVPVDRPNTAAGVQFALRLSLPVFFTPPGARAEPGWSLGRDHRGRRLVELGNRGTAHIHVRQLRITDARGRELTAGSPAPFYVLAGKSRSLPLRTDRYSSPIRIEAVTNIGPVAIDLHE